jgi:hypothetical protein
VKYGKPRVQEKYICDIYFYYLFSFRTLDDYCKLQITNEHTFNDNYNLTPGLNNRNQTSDRLDTGILFEHLFYFFLLF